VKVHAQSVLAQNRSAHCVTAISFCWNLNVSVNVLLVILVILTQENARRKLKVTFYCPRFLNKFCLGLNSWQLGLAIGLPIFCVGTSVFLYWLIAKARLKVHPFKEAQPKFDRLPMSPSQTAHISPRKDLIDQIKEDFHLSAA